MGSCAGSQARPSTIAQSCVCLPQDCCRSHLSKWRQQLGAELCSWSTKDSKVMVASLILSASGGLRDARESNSQGSKKLSGVETWKEECSGQRETLGFESSLFSLFFLLHVFILPLFQNPSVYVQQNLTFLNWKLSHPKSSCKGRSGDVHGEIPASLESCHVHRFQPP